MLLIYTPVITNRTRYVFDHIFREQFGIEYAITNDTNAWINERSIAKFCYAPEPLEEGIYFFSNGLLDRNDISEQDLNTGTYGDIAFLFAHNDTRSLLNFDPFAAVFYLLSRYEEYLESAPAEHGNYDHRQSVLHKLNAMHTPVVERWLNILKHMLQQAFPSLRFKQNSATYLLSFDIDVAYAYKNRSFARTAGGLCKNILSLNFKVLGDQLRTLLNRRDDIFDSYGYIFDKIKSSPAIFFFNMGKYGRYDKNPSYKNPVFRQLIGSIGERCWVGLHPSFASNKSKHLLSEEKNKLQDITGKEITASRQHYLKMTLPETYQNLIDNKINSDFTMRYYYDYGFRAGTCRPFLFFDLQKNETTNLRLYPFAIMEGTLNDVLKLRVEEAKQIMAKLLQTIKEHDGIFIPLWHNSTLSDADGWTGWRQVFEQMLFELKENDFKEITQL